MTLSAAAPATAFTADSNLRQKGGEAHHQVFLSVHNGSAAEDILVRIHVRIYQPAALLGVFLGHRAPAQFGQRGKKAIAFEHPHRPAEFAPGHTQAALEKRGRGSGLRHGAAQFQAHARASHGADARQGRAAGGDLLVFVELRPVERLRIIGQESGLQSEIAKHFFQVAQVGGRHHAGKHVDVLAGRSAFGQLLHQGPHGGMKTVHMSAAITRRRHVHH
jgi:hypothetical protein